MRAEGVDIARLAAALSAALAGGDADTGADAGANAAENNVFWIPVIAVVAALWTAYDIAETYREEGGEAALKQLALDGAIAVATGGAGKIVYKVGGRLFKSAPKAYQAVKKLGLWRKKTRKLSGGPSVKIAGKTCVYDCVINGTTRYVGITDDIARRGREHLSQKGIKIKEILGLENLSRADARAVEQTLINYYGLGKNGGTLINRINSISAIKNPTEYEKALIRGAELLKKAKYREF